MMINSFYFLLTSIAIAATGGEVCVHPLTEKSPPLARATAKKEKVETFAESEPNNPACIGICPSSYFVRPEAAVSGTELHIVSVLAPPPAVIENEKYTPGTVNVNVMATPKPIVLALISSQPTVWKLNLQSGAKVKKVFIGGGDARRSYTVGFREADVERMPLEMPTRDFPDHWELEHAYDKPFAEQIAPVLKATEMKATSFQGFKTTGAVSVPFYSNQTEILKRSKPELPTGQSIEIPDAQIELLEEKKLIKFDLRRKIKVADLAQNQAHTRYPTGYVFDEESKEGYLLVDEGVLNLNTRKLFKTPLEIGNLQALHAITYDSKNHRILVFKANGGGTLLISLSLKTEKWEILAKSREMINGAIASNPVDGFIYATNDTFFDNYKIKSISVYSTDLKLIRKIPLKREFFFVPHGLLHLEYKDGVLIFVDNRTSDTKIAQAQIVAIDPQCGEIQEIQ